MDRLQCCAEWQQILIVVAVLVSFAALSLWGTRLKHRYLRHTGYVLSDVHPAGEEAEHREPRQQRHC